MQQQQRPGMSPEGMEMQHSPGDPFIGSGPTPGPFSTSTEGPASTRGHTKQESGDSGLGGMGTQFSIARGPGEEFMEEGMDEGKLQNPTMYCCDIWLLSHDQTYEPFIVIALLLHFNYWVIFKM